MARIQLLLNSLFIIELAIAATSTRTRRSSSHRHQRGHQQKHQHQNQRRSNNNNVFNNNDDGSITSNNFGKYDELRLALSTEQQSDANTTTTKTRIIEPLHGVNDPTYVGRNLHRIQQSSEDDDDDDDEIILCHVPIMLRFTDGGTSSNFLGSWDVAYAGSVGAMLAMEHFNEGNGYVVDKLQDIHKTCPIRFTTEIIDTESSGFSAVKALTRILTRSPLSVDKPQPCAIFGTQISKVTSKVASLSGVFDLLQISSSAMSSELDNSVQYPTLIRSHTDVTGFGQMSVSYLVNNLGITKFGLLFPNDSYGLSFQKSIVDAGISYETIIESHTYSPSMEGITPEEFDLNVRRALTYLKNTGYNYFIGAFYPEYYGRIMDIAGEMGVAGPGKFWLTSGTADTAPFLMSGKFILRTDSYAAKSITGSGVIFCKGGLPGVGNSYDRFSKLWSDIGTNNQSLSYMNSKQPKVVPSEEDGNNNDINQESLSSPYTKTMDYFQNFPHHIVTFSYDAIVGLGLSACKALMTSTNGNKFTGTEHHSIFANNNITKFRGASGDFVLRQEFPTRTADSSYFVMGNLIQKKINDTHSSFQKSPIPFFYDTQNQRWESYKSKEFIYSDGTSIPPIETIPEEDDEETSSTNQSLRLLSIILVVVLPLTTIVCITAIFLYTKKQRNAADSVWSVQSSELKFADPPEVLGRGTFGLVLLAEYRGTNVAVKRVIPPRIIAKEFHRNALLGTSSNNNAERSSLESKNDYLRTSMHSLLGSVEDLDPFQSATLHSIHDFNDDLECAPPLSTKNNGTSRTNVSSTVRFINNGDDNKSKSSHERFSEEYLTSHSSGDGTYLRKSGSFGDLTGRPASSGMNNGSDDNKKSKSLMKSLFYGDEYSQLKADFIVEMRYLSKLRHPCITTVMGAVISRKEEPMLVMEFMEMGSLYDILHNDTMVMEGELVLPILKDITSGVRFLHAANPQVIHGDLKAQNVLVDNKLRAKVADFGLSQKKQIGGTGTPLWMAPELLRRESENTAASDVYSFGIILYEVYSRKDPYEGEDPKTVLKEICDPIINKRPPIPKSMPPAMASLMSDCLVGQAEKRPTLEEIDNRLKRLDIENVEPSVLTKSKKIQEAERNANLLHSVFPKHIAEALRDGRKIEPEHHDCVTIFFSDIVGFTTISASTTPQKICDMLDRLYIKFDALSVKHDVFKIETIGDAWMGATNLVHKDQQSCDHVKRIADFAIDAVKAANETLIDVDDPTKGYVQIRVGFHSGPITSNVVGSRNPRYTLFGDTVNTASRMESNSLAGRIHCSSRSAVLLREQAPSMPLLCRGSIAIKGKGEMETYFVNEGSTSSTGGDGSNLQKADDGTTIDDKDRNQTYDKKHRYS